MPKNPDIYKAIRGFVAEAIELLVIMIKQGQRPDIKQYDEPMFDDQGYHGSIARAVPDYSRFIINNEDRIKTIPGYKDGAESLCNQEIIKNHYKGRISNSAGKVIDDPNIRSVVGREFLIRPLAALLDGKDGLVFDGDAFDLLYKGIEENLHSPEKRHYFAPMFNFKSESEKVELEGGVVISKLSAELFTRIWKLSLLDLLPGHMIFETKYVMEQFYEHPSGKPISDEHPRQKFRHVIYALRLFKKGVPGISALYSRAVGFSSAISGSISASDSMSFMGPEYVLASAEVANFKEFWKFYLTTATSKNKFIEIAVRRFNTGLEERVVEDKLIDYVIALEALYVSEVDELPYRLSLRASMLLGKGREDTKFVREFLTESYKVRNKIAHGKPTKPVRIMGEEIALNKLVSELEDYVRKSIIAFMSLSVNLGPQENIIKSLEESVTDQDTRIEIASKSKLSFIDYS